MKFGDIWKTPASYLAGGPGWVAGAAGALSAYSPGTFNQIFGEKDNSAEKNAALQREFAQNSIQWRVEDAKKAGIHPLYALGAAGASATPVYSSDADAGSLGQMGQDLSRAFMATRGAEERAATRLRLENMGLQNDLLRSQIARENSAQIGPGLPVGDPVVKRGHEVSAPVKDVGFSETKTGLAPVPGKDVKERIEDNLVQETMWAIRNNLMPNLGFTARRGLAPSRSLLPKGSDYWDWSYTQQEWQPRKYPKGVIYRADGY